jgi:hypothetical protein
VLQPNPETRRGALGERRSPRDPATCAVREALRRVSVGVVVSCAVREVLRRVSVGVVVSCAVREVLRRVSVGVVVSCAVREALRRVSVGVVRQQGASQSVSSSKLRLVEVLDFI